MYGKKSGDNHSKSLSKFTEHDLKQMHDYDLLQKDKSLLDIVKLNEANLVNFGVTSEMAMDFPNKLVFYEEALGGKDSKFAESKAARQKLNEMFEKAIEILKEELDQMMTLIRPSQSGAYNQYAAARVIKDL